MNWSKYQKDILKEFKKTGTQAFLREKQVGEYDITSGKKMPTVTKEDIVYVIFKSSEYEREPVGADEVVIMSTIPETIDISNPKNKYLVINDREYTINRTKSLQPGGVPIFFKLFCVG